MIGKSGGRAARRRLARLPGKVRMSRLSIILLVVVVVIVGGLFVLQSMAREVPQTRVEKPVPADALAH